MYLTLIHASETSFWNLTANLITSKSSFTQFWLVVTWLREELQIIRKEETQSLQILSQNVLGSPAVTALIKAPLSRGNALVRIGSFTRGWKQRSQNQWKTYRRELKTDKLVALYCKWSCLSHADMQTWRLMAQKELHPWQGKLPGRGGTNVLY